MIKKYKENEIDKLTTILKNDGVISVPTDTVYGICARANSIKAYNKLLTVKNRPLPKAFPVMCANIEQIKEIAIVNKHAEKLIKAFMPGPITIVLKQKKCKRKDICIENDTIAVRMATSRVLEDLIKQVGCPVFMTSANQSGESTCTNIDEIEKACPMLDGILEGNVTYGKASTIVDCTLDEIKILRSGPIAIEQLLKVI